MTARVVRFPTERTTPPAVCWCDDVQTMHDCPVHHCPPKWTTRPAPEFGVPKVEQ